ncbi:substrate-binding domain-containing protein [Desulfovibrio sp. OttesenSCG-928-C06]|nr:substrate-binding domain-containing protein [Desulfovibrio sp. OttesenSCG-928-C06]
MAARHEYSAKTLALPKRTALTLSGSLLFLLAALMLALSLAGCKSSTPPIPDPPAYVALGENGEANAPQAHQADKTPGQENAIATAMLGQTRQPAQAAPDTASDAAEPQQYATGQEMIPVVTAQATADAAALAAAQSATQMNSTDPAALPAQTNQTAQEQILPVTAPARPLAGLVLGPFSHLPHRQMASEARKYAKSLDEFDLEVIHAPNAGAVQAQAAAIVKLVEQRATAIALAPLDPYSYDLAQAIKKAVDSGIAVMTFDQPMNSETLTASGLPAELPFAGPDNRAGAELAASQLASGLKAGAKVAIVEDESMNMAGSASTAARLQGFEQVLRANSLKLAVTISSGPNAETAGEAVSAQLRNHRDLQGILVTGPTAAYGTVLALEEAKREGRVKVAAYGISPELEDLVLEGRLLGTIDDFQQNWAVEALKNALENSGKPQADRNAGTRITLPQTLIKKAELGGMD